MICSVSAVVLLFIWCLVKVLTTPGESEHMHGFEQEPPDVAAQRSRDAHQ
ncbi:MAG: hypothetical protein E1N59_844 [Puniceicoccaceae bacterium 5H]|nr:MAG: hypothetical protein E1N59_844 [Puniceicoccaceae bacterium 5H]